MRKVFFSSSVVCSFEMCSRSFAPPSRPLVNWMAWFFISMSGMWYCSAIVKYSKKMSFLFARV